MSSIRSICVWFLVAAVTCSAAYSEPSLGSVAKHQALLDLGTDLRLMCVAAHPDDEDGATLAMYRKKYGYTTFALLATRGEGGQNEIGPELYEELAVLRTDEMARASAITGAELHFLNMPEFGYSKTREEAYEIWGYDVTLERTVRKVRELRPDVIITNHGPTGAHGHHQAIGKAIQDAFDVSGDPNVYPEHMAQGLEPWQPARLYVRSFRGGSGARIDFNELDPVRGISYAAIAANALREHETQGMGFFIDRFLTSRSTASYGLVKEYEGGVQGAGSVNAPGGTLFDGLKDRVSPDARQTSSEGASGLTLGSAIASMQRAQGWSETAQAQANRLAVAVSELHLTARVNDAQVVPGQELTISVEAIDYGTKEAKGIAFDVLASPWFAATVPVGTTGTFTPQGFAMATFKVRVPEEQPRTIPHDEFVFADNFLKPQVTVLATVDVQGTALKLEAPVYVDVAPPTAIEFVEAPYLVQYEQEESPTARMLVTNHSGGVSEVTIRISAASGLVAEQNEIGVKFAGEGEQKVVSVPVEISRRLASGDYALRAEVVETGYVAETSARVVDVRVPRSKNVGVILSYDDTFMNTLARLDVPHRAIEAVDFLPERLDEFTTIIVDIRAYLVRGDLVANNQALLDYVHRGGSVIVMYQKTFEWKPEYAPYDIQLGRGRVTVEDAPMDILAPEHPMFNSPNVIAPEDWDGWRQERGLYFPSRWADEYTPLINVADPGESPPPGSCLIAQYGEGTYMYTALGWYRQLRELHPGTLRVFANMLDL